MRLRVVLDTNVVVSGLLFGGPPRRILELALAGAVEVATSPVLEEELRRVLEWKFPRHRPAIQETLAALQEIMTHVISHRTVSAISEDPSDNRVLECALAARADAVVSGDRHLLACGKFRGIPILSPRAFLSRRFSNP